MTGENASPASGWRVKDVYWGPVWLGFVIGLLSTLLAGVPLLLITGSSWLMAMAGTVGLLIAGIVAGRRIRPLFAIVNGALLAILYNITMSLLFFIGSFLQILPEPLPGLPQGDSTFFFAWPLVQFAIGIFGTVLGSRIVTRQPDKGD